MGKRGTDITQSKLRSLTKRYPNQKELEIKYNIERCSIYDTEKFKDIYNRWWALNKKD